MDIEALKVFFQYGGLNSILLIYILAKLFMLDFRVKKLELNGFSKSFEKNTGSSAGKNP